MQRPSRCRPIAFSPATRPSRALLMPANDVQYKVMCLLQANPRMSQRDVARELGVSLGKVNYCFRALIGKGWVKASNFKNSKNKAAYMYLLTPRGVEQKGRLAVEFLKIKMREYEDLRIEIERIRQQAGASDIE